MEAKEVIAMLQLTQGATIFSAEYIGNQIDRNQAKRTIYHFKDVMGLNLRKDELVVVETGASFSIVKVVETGIPFHQLPIAVQDLKHAVQRVDLTTLDRIKAAEGQATNELALTEVNQRLEAHRQALGTVGFEKVKNLLGVVKDRALDGVQEDIPYAKVQTYGDTVEGQVIEDETIAERMQRRARERAAERKVDGYADVYPEERSEKD
jgi:hypothetical protein